MNAQYSKFSPLTVAVKGNIRDLRLNEGHTMNEAASLFSISRKQLEDIETIRNYGCHIDLEFLAKVAVIYKTSIDAIVGALPNNANLKYYDRPRKRQGSASRKR